MYFSIFIKLFSSFLVLYSIYQLGSLSGLFSERSGTANIAIEGNIIVAASIFAIIWAAMSGTGILPYISLIISIFISVFISSFYILLLGFITNKYFANQIIVGTGLNLLAPALGFFLYGFLVADSSTSVAPSFGNWIIFVKGNQFQTLFIYFIITVIIIVLISIFILNKTVFGLRLKSAGENPYSLETSGHSVFKMRMMALWISGILSSFAGVIFLTKSTFSFTVNGAGFLSLGILILGQWRVSGTVIGSIIFAFFISFFQNWTIVFPDYKDLQYLMNIIPFIIPLIGLMIFKSHSAPKVVGTNFKKDQR